MKHYLNKVDEISRRKFIGYLAKSCLGVGLASTIQPSLSLFGQDYSRPRPKARNVIYIYLQGGMSHIDTFDPKPGSPSQGPVEALKTSADDILVSQYFPNMAKQMDKVAVIRSMFTNQGAHAPGTYYMHTSYTTRGTIKHPGLGAWLSKIEGRTNSTLPGNVRIGGSSNMPGGAGFLEATHQPLFIGDPQKGLQDCSLPTNLSEERFQKRLEISHWMDHKFHDKYEQEDLYAYTEAYRSAIKLMKSEDLKAFDIGAEPEAMKELYGNTKFGQGCLLARRLIENDVRFVEVVHGGWDTHNDNFDRVEELSTPLDIGLSALLMDLERRGLLDETLVVVSTEFGRSSEINANDGRNHHPQAFTCLLAGGGIRGGQSYGKTNKIGSEVIENRVEVPDFNATIAYALGLPTDKIFYSPEGRPFQVANHGKPITAIF
jgi:hypothetical protein